MLFDVAINVKLVTTPNNAPLPPTSKANNDAVIIRRVRCSMMLVLDIDMFVTRVVVAVVTCVVVCGIGDACISRGGVVISIFICCTMCCCTYRRNNIIMVIIVVVIIIISTRINNTTDKRSVNTWCALMTT